MIDRDKFDLAMWRSDMGWTQARAAEALGMSRRAYGFMENDRTPLTERTALACLYIKDHPITYKRYLTYP